MSPTLVELLDRVLAPAGIAYITHEERPFRIGFFEDADSKFITRTTSSRVRSGKSGAQVKVFLHALARS